MITHTGIVTKVSGDKVTVAIAPEADECHGCAVAMLCHKKETVEIDTPGADASLRGTRVTIGTDDSVQRRAVVLFLVIPVVLLVGVLALSIGLGAGDTAAVVMSVGAAGLWYLSLYLLRKKITKTVRFRIIN